MKLTEKEKEQILKSGAEAMSKIIERMSIEMGELEEENKKLKSDLAFERTMLDNVKAEYKSLQNVIKKLKEEKEFFYKSAKQFREDAESWRKEAELLLGIEIFGKTLSERIDDDKKVVRMDTSCMEEDTLQELRDLGEI